MTVCVGGRTSTYSIAYDHAIVPASRAAHLSRTAALGLLLFLSGAAALIYQLLWIKQLSLVVGVDVYAVTTAVSAFFGGLALGSRVFGRRAESSGRPLRLYAALELGIAVLGVGITLALAHAAAPFAQLESRVGLLAWAVPFLLVGAPATLMGGTMPVLIRAVSPGSGQLGRTGGQLYAANTAGAIAGALLVPFLLVPAFGVTGSALAAAALNLAAAAPAACRGGALRAEAASPGAALRAGAASPGARASRAGARTRAAPLRRWPAASRWATRSSGPRPSRSSSARACSHSRSCSPRTSPVWQSAAPCIRASQTACATPGARSAC